MIGLLRWAAAFVALVVAGVASAQDARALQIREAQKADERTFAYFAKFKTALTARFGHDPLLSRITFIQADRTIIDYDRRGTFTRRKDPYDAGPAVELDAGKAGAAKFDAYGPQRIAGTVNSPQGGKGAFARNKALKLDVKFDAPLSRSWPP